MTFQIIFAFIQLTYFAASPVTLTFSGQAACVLRHSFNLLLAYAMERNRGYMLGFFNSKFNSSDLNF